MWKLAEGHDCFGRTMMNFDFSEKVKIHVCLTKEMFVCVSLRGSAADKKYFVPFVSSVAGGEIK